MYKVPEPPKYPENMTKLFDPNIEVSYGYFRCMACGCQFYGGGPAIHNKWCTHTGYDNEVVVYFYGPKERR